MPRFNLEQLKTFLYVVRLGSISQASRMLNLTQPAVTTRIKTLEQTLSGDVFERTTSGLRLTRRGELLRKYAEKFEYLGDLLEQNVVDPSSIDGYVKIGVSEIIAQCWLPDFIEALGHRYPKIDVEIIVELSDDLRVALREGALDLAILRGPFSEETIDSIELPAFDLGWYRAAAPPPDNDRATEYFSKPVIIDARDTRHRREVKAQLLNRVGPEISFIFSASLAATFRLVEAGIGIAALPRVLVDEHVSRGRIREFDPGWHPAPLKFSASYNVEPRRHIVAAAAEIALQAALDYEAKKDLGRMNGTEFAGRG